MKAERFRDLVKRGRPEDLEEVYEYLWSAEQGKGVFPELDSSDVPGTRVNWALLEQVALKRTPREWLTDKLDALSQGTWVVVMPLLVLAAPVVLTACFLWARAMFPFSGALTKFAVVGVVSGASILGLLTLAIAANWTFRRAVTPEPALVLNPETAPAKGASLWRFFARTVPAFSTVGAVGCAAAVVIVIAAMIWRVDDHSFVEERLNDRAFSIIERYSFVIDDEDRAQRMVATMSSATISDPNMFDPIVYVHERNQNYWESARLHSLCRESIVSTPGVVTMLPARELLREEQLHRSAARGEISVVFVGSNADGDSVRIRYVLPDLVEELESEEMRMVLIDRLLAQLAELSVGEKNTLAVALEWDGRSSEAKPLYDQALKEDPSSPLTWTNALNFWGEVVAAGGTDSATESPNL